MIGKNRHPGRVKFGPVVVTRVIFMLCAGVGIPGFQKLKQASQRMQCQNNTKQIGISIENYRDANGHFPTATMPNDKLPIDKRFSWQFAIVPYVESDNIYGRANRTIAWDDESNRYSTHFSHRVYTCGWIREKRFNSLNTSYLGISGVGTDAATFPLDHPDAGIFGYDRKWKANEVPGQTLMVLETMTGGPWAQGGYSTVRGIEPTTVFGTTTPFGSPHNSGGSYFSPIVGANAGFADGSVRFLHHNIDAELLKALARVRGDKTGLDF